METWITSDVHLGSRQCRVGIFRAFLERIPADVRLIFNGDVVTRLRREGKLPDSHRAALERLRELSQRQEVIWIGGNHDRSFRLRGEHAITFATSYKVGKTLYITHGDRFDHLMPTLRFLLLPVKVVYEFCTRVVGSKTHVTDFAKRFPGVYRILNGHVMRNATSFAAEEGFRAVTCGHTHHPENQELGGVRYFNTGCWTEDAAHVLVVREDESLDLRTVGADGSLKKG